MQIFAYSVLASDISASTERVASASAERAGSGEYLLADIEVKFGLIVFK